MCELRYVSLPNSPSRCINSCKIKCAKKTGTTFLFTGPRHGAYSGFSKLDNALEIFTSAFNGIQVNAEENIMTVGGAVVFKDAIDALHAVGKNIRESSYKLLICFETDLW